MKHKINKVNFETWNSWDMPYYAEVRSSLPDNSLRQHFEKKPKSNSGFWFIIVMLCTTIIVMKWEEIKAFFEKLEQNSPTESTIKEQDTKAA